MKKLKQTILPIFLTVLGCLGLFTSCGTEQEEFHSLQTGFANGRNFAFADEVKAGFVVIATDSWELTCDRTWATLNYNRQDMDKVQVTVTASWATFTELYSSMRATCGPCVPTLSGPAPS